MGVSARPVSTSDRMSRRLLLLCVLISLGALNTETASTLRSRRQAGECEEATDSFDECTNAAYDDYKAAFEAGDDGKPDWMARKACNYMTAAVEECGDELIGDCYSEEDVINMKDHQLKNVLEVLEKSVEEWDTDKCEAVRAHVERVKRLDDGGDEDFDNDGIMNNDDEDDDNDGIMDDEDPDDDNDGIVDDEDKDDDNDGVPDSEDDCKYYGDCDYDDSEEGEDSDDDGVPDDVDDDDDNDGIPDEEDGDDDNDGIPDEDDNDDDYYDDTDNDGIPDDEDNDDDNDGIPDEEDVDDDNDGIPDEEYEEEDTEEEPEDDSEESSAGVAGLSFALFAIVIGCIA